MALFIFYNNMKNDIWGSALRVLANISAWVAFPVLIGVFLGRWLDKRFDTTPWLFLITIGVCFLVSMYGLVINAQREFKRIEDLSKKSGSVLSPEQNIKESDKFKD